MPRELLQKVYDPAQVERKWYPYWEQSGYFTADNASQKPGSPSLSLLRM